MLSVLCSASQVDRVTFQRLTAWFNNNRPASERGIGHEWLPLLQQLHQIRNPRPRRRTAAQQFMQDYPKEFNAAFVSRHGDGRHLQPAERLNLCMELAKSMVNGGHSHLFNDLERKAKQQHEKALVEWELSLDNISEASDVSTYVPISSSLKIADSYISFQCPRYSFRRCSSSPPSDRFIRGLLRFAHRWRC